MKVVLATDLDRTVIFSKRFLGEYEPKVSYHVSETLDGNTISYIADTVANRLKDINSRKNIDVVPVTSRSKDEYKRVNLGFTPEYAIVSSGGTILKDGKPIEEYEEYIRKHIDMNRMADVAMEVNCLYSVSRDCKLIDNKFVFTKTDNPTECEKEIIPLISEYPDFNFHIQGKKIYVIPNAFSKAVALRWLQHRNEYNKIVATGDSELDINMLYIADYAVVPKHGELITKGIVQDGIIADAGIECSMKAMDIIEEIIKNE